MDCSETAPRRASAGRRMGPDPLVLGVACAVPPHALAQETIVAAARGVFGPRLRDFERLAPVFANAGIATRYASRPLSWFLEPRSWAEKNEVYLESALELLEQAARACLERSGLAPSEVGAVVLVSSTGIATPSLDSLLIERLGLPLETIRLPVFGLGCAGGVLGLSRAGDLARARPGANVLLLVVELCTLTVRHGDLSATNIVATALFGDGVGAALLRCEAEGTGAGSGPRLGAAGEHTWPGTRAIMGWRVADDGLGVIFSQDIPMLIRQRLPAVVESFLTRQGLTLADLAGVICHPGGVKVLSAIEEVLAPVCDGLAESWAVLRDFGNMSAATVLFVLERRIAAGGRGLHLMSAFGPGFTAALQLVEL
jgi:alkylresorcinol/alkylpyrone synthase